MKIKTIQFQIDPLADLETTWQSLAEAGCTLLYSEADDESQRVFGHLPSDISKENLQKLCPEILSIDSVELPEIDWQGQWAAHEAYYDGYLHVDLSEYAELASSLKLIPGPGFGDHSHPTTRLVLKLMPGFVSGKCVIDIGCGSGILSLAASALGACTVYGIDIDKDAVDHSRENAKVNGMADEIKFLLPEAFEKLREEAVVLMNMIQSEQKVAWESLQSVLGPLPSVIVTSGILSEGREAYLRQCSEWGWRLVSELEEAGWLGFVFVNFGKR